MLVEIGSQTIERVPGRYGLFFNPIVRFPVPGIIKYHSEIFVPLVGGIKPRRMMKDFPRAGGRVSVCLHVHGKSYQFREIRPPPVLIAIDA